MSYIIKLVSTVTLGKIVEKIVYSYITKDNIIKYWYGENIFEIKNDPLWNSEMKRSSQLYKILTSYEII